MGKKFMMDKHVVDSLEKNHKESFGEISRTEVLNFILSSLDRKSVYLEIGVRNPRDNFDLIIANEKYSVDPGIEFKENPVDFKMTSDEFFQNLSNGNILKKDILFDVIFIDGLHLAYQVDLDIKNATKYLKPDGFIVLHDCNPPTEWNARETYYFLHSPAFSWWNGTVWKAFLKWRKNKLFGSCCVDCDFGIGVISKRLANNNIQVPDDEFYDFIYFSKNRKKLLNLISFKEFKEQILLNELSS